MSKNFTTVVVCRLRIRDVRPSARDGDLPNVLCMVAYVLDENLQHVRTIKMWRGEFGTAPPFDIGPDTLFVAYSAWAEMTCFMTLGWKFPVHVFDLHTAYLAASNILLPYNPDEVRKRQRKTPARRLPRLRDRGLGAHRQGKDRGRHRRRPLAQLRHEAVFDYCEEDVRKSTYCCCRAIARTSVTIATRRRRARAALVELFSAKAVAQIQARGMPIDMPLWNLVQENKAAVIGALLRQFDPSHGSDDPIYTPEGEWSYDRFERWLASVGVTAWPRLESGQLDIDGDAFRLMYHVPGIEGLHALRDSLGVIVRAKLPIGRDGRNRPSLFPFCTATGRNAHAKSLYNAHAGMRSFMVFPPDTIGVYLDWRTQEVGVAAALSGDQALIDDYVGGDVYHALGPAVRPDRRPRRQALERQNTPTMRQRMKSLQLGINYGMGVPSLAKVWTATR